MKVIVTGAAGFIGYHLIASLLNQSDPLLKFDILGIDDLSTGLNKNLEDLKNFSDPLNQNSFECIHYKLGSNSLSTHNEEFDVMIHLAASVGVKNIVDNPFNGIMNNTESTFEAIKLAKQMKVKKFIFLSTSEVYGSNLGNLREDMTLMVGCPENYPRCSYAAAKILDEFAVLNSGLNAVVIRPFNIVGYRQRHEFGMVLPRFMRAAMADEPLEVYDDGLQVRTFTDVRDFVKLLNKIISGEAKLSHQVYNFGSKNSLSIKELAQKVVQITESKSEVHHISSKTVYNQKFCEDLIRKPDLDRLSKIINVAEFTKMDNIIYTIMTHEIFTPFATKGLLCDQMVSQ